MEGGTASANSSTDASHVQSVMEAWREASGSGWDVSSSADTYLWAPPALGGTTTDLDNEDISERAEGKPILTINTLGTPSPPSVSATADPTLLTFTTAPPLPGQTHQYHG